MRDCVSRKKTLPKIELFYFKYPLNQNEQVWVVAAALERRSRIQACGVCLCARLAM